MPNMMKTISIICCVLVMSITLLLASLLHSSEGFEKRQDRQCFFSVYVSSASSCWYQSLNDEESRY